MSALRYLTISQDARVAGLPGITEGATKLPFSEFFVALLLPKLPRSTGDEIAIVRELGEALEKAEPGTVVELREATWAALSRAVQALELNGPLTLRCLDFFEAVATAKTERQVEKTAAASVGKKAKL